MTDSLSFWLDKGSVLRETSAREEGPALPDDTPFAGVSTDTRDLRPDMLFVALRGDAFDGHDYVGEAFRKGARAALVSRSVEATGPLLIVGDTRLALQGLARAIVRKRFAEGKRLVTLTGTAGKTTTRELLCLVLSAEGRRPHTNRQNWNNEIGVPRTLWEWGEKDGDAVLEVGIRKPGDMDYLSSVLVSDASIVTSVGEGHLETLGSVEGVWKEKSHLLNWVRPGGAIVLPLDLLFRYPASPVFRERQRRFFFVELDPDPGDSARGPRSVPEGSTILTGTLRKEEGGKWILSGTTGPESFSWKMPSPSSILAMDALLALAAGNALGVSLQEGANHLENFSPLPGRMQEKERRKERCFFSTITIPIPFPSGVLSSGVPRSGKKRRLSPGGNQENSSPFLETCWSWGKIPPVSTGKPAGSPPKLPFLQSSTRVIFSRNSARATFPAKAKRPDLSLFRGRRLPDRVFFRS